MEEKIISALKQVTGEADVELEITANPQFGDFSTNLALLLAAKNQQKPKEVAAGIVGQLKKSGILDGEITKIEVAGAGFINFWLSTDILLDNLIEIDRLKEKYGRQKIGHGQTVVIDYSSPNIAKRFSIGHLRSTIIGQALYNIYGFLGYETIGDNHLGDWGTQFGKLLYMIDQQQLTEKDLSIDKLEELYIKFHQLLDSGKDQSLEEKARQWFKKLEDGDIRARQLWQYCVKVSMAEFDRIYDLLAVRFDYEYGESFYQSEMRLLEKDKKVQAVLTPGEDGKSKVIDLSESGLIPLMFKKSDGATTYATRDLACLRFRSRKWSPDIIIYEVGVEQTLHFQQVFAAATKIGLVKKNTILYHTRHGLYLAASGKKFATRQGQTIKLEEILTEAIKKAAAIIQNSQTGRGLTAQAAGKVAEAVGIGAIKYFDLMHAVTSDIVFDWDKILNLTGNSGPYLQYTYARTQSVLEKSPLKDYQLPREAQAEINAEELSLLRALFQFSGIIRGVAKNYSPNILCNYLYTVAQKFNLFYDRCKIIGSENSQLRLLLTRASGQVLKNGLELLGLKTLDKM